MPYSQAALIIIYLCICINKYLKATFGLTFCLCSEPVIHGYTLKAYMQQEMPLTQKSQQHILPYIGLNSLPKTHYSQINFSKAKIICLTIPHRPSPSAFIVSSGFFFVYGLKSPFQFICSLIYSNSFSSFPSSPSAQLYMYYICTIQNIWVPFEILIEPAH